MDPLCNELSTCCNHYYTTAALMSLTQIYGHLVLFGGGGYTYGSHMMVDGASGLQVPWAVLVTWG